ncbi:hypothetical protein HK100_007788 [Physocladia obscura]|uniref:Uncharacterized protein n=1 Tax=Physocladia obscura TaxID=109957 RepID=A0AAD5TA49_9FUNG|nr:hypothetical protein HK100_007788 [Physocladia obscura]
MDDSETGSDVVFPLLAPARIRILVVPVSGTDATGRFVPVIAAAFRRNVDLVRQFSVVSVRDATPSDMRSNLSPENTHTANSCVF